MYRFKVFSIYMHKITKFTNKCIWNIVSIWIWLVIAFDGGYLYSNAIATRFNVNVSRRQQRYNENI